MPAFTCTGTFVHIQVYKNNSPKLQQAEGCAISANCIFICLKENSTILLFYFRGSGQEVGRSCHILEFKGKKVMVSTPVHCKPKQITDVQTVATDSQVFS